MLFSQWVQKYEGNKIDYDGVYGVQCVDLIKHYIDKVLDIKPKSIGNAIDYYKKRKTLKYLKNNFTPYDFKFGFQYKKGDIIVMQGSSSFGHIAVCSGKYNNKGVYAYDQNYKGSGDGMTLRLFEFNGNYKIKCILRPKNQKNINKNVQYYPKFNGTTLSIVDALTGLKIDSSYKHRVKIARANGIIMYTGTPNENIKLLNLLKKGKLIKP